MIQRLLTVKEMNPLKIKDNSHIAKFKFADISTLTNKIADKPLEQLEREGMFVFPCVLQDADDITQNQMILQTANDKYRSSNIMGFLGCGNERLVIESRFCAGGHDYFFQYLLSKVLDFPNFVSLDTDANRDNRLFNYLLFLFPYYLKKAVRKGIYKKYKQNRYNNSNLRGSIDISRHIKTNTPFVGNIAYNRREFSYDNHLTELLRHTVEFIKTKSCAQSILRRIKYEIQLVIEVTPGYEPYDRHKIIEANKKQPIRHAYYNEYMALQRLCILILQHQKHQIGIGSKQIYGILFDGAWLWEEYVNSLIKEHFYHPMNKSGKGAQYLFNDNNSNIGRVYPDFISTDCESRIIADAKYKPLDNIGNRDYLQVLAYMFRFDAKIGYYLYPEENGREEQVLKMNQGISYENDVTRRDDIQVIKRGLKIPTDANDYDDFKTKIKKSEDEFRQALGIVCEQVNLSL